jgi:probable HAF family extracellular repeat protein
MTSLGDLPGGNFQSQALGTSADGAVVVGYGYSASGSEAFRWQGGVMTGLGDLPGGSFVSDARGVSADGEVVVGYSNSASGAEAFRWQGGVMTGLGDLSGGDFQSIAWGVSADGNVVVGHSNSASGVEAFRWQGGVMTGLGDLPGGSFFSRAIATSANGEVVVGGSLIAATTQEAFIWKSDTGMQRLRDVLIEQGATGLTGWNLFEATGVSADGLTIVGSALNPSFQQQAFVARLVAVPEPGTLALMGMAIAALAFRRWYSTN